MECDIYGIYGDIHAIRGMAQNNHIGYYRTGYIIGHVVDPEIYQSSSMHSSLQYAVQSPI